MNTPTAPRSELQIALQIVQAHPEATGAELDALVREALRLQTTVMARIWRIQAHLLLHEQPQEIFVPEPLRAQLPRVAVTAVVHHVEQREDGWTYGTIFYGGARWQVMHLDRRWVVDRKL
jgi:hypothetical protein